MTVARVDANEEHAASPRRAGALRRLVRRAAKCIGWTVAAAAATAAAMVFTPAGNWLSDALIRVDEPRPADFIVVLGGNPERAVEAADLFRAEWAKTVIVSSFDDSTDRLADVLAAGGVPRKAILLDRDATRTWDHPRTVAALPGVDKATSRVLVVTSPFHTSRARACFDRQGYKHVSLCCPQWQVGGRYGPREDWKAKAANLPNKLHEVLAWGYYKFRGWL